MLRDFQLWTPLSFFEKANAPEGQSRRIGGVVSTEVEDKQEETVLQDGLDFTPFLKGGWFNDNHSKKTTDILGYPDRAPQKFRKGEILPDGKVATSNCTWAEGYLLPTPEATKLWELGKALAKAGDARRLGFSIEGRVKKRMGPGGKIVAKAEVSNIAVTNCPVGEGTRLEALAKSLREAAAETDPDTDEDLDKGLGMGAATPGVAVAGTGPQTGEGAGRVLTPQHLEDEDDKDPKDLSKGEAVSFIRGWLSCDQATAERAYSAIQDLKAAQLL